MTQPFRLTKTLVFSLICLAALLAAGITTVLGAVSVTVSPAALNGWAFAASAGGSASFSAGPGSAPLGVGSARFTSDAPGSGTAALATSQFAGTLLTDITGLSYSTYVKSASSTAVNLALEVNFDGSTSGQLIFAPPSELVQLNAWQTWSPITFTWYADQTPDGTCLEATPCSWGTITTKWSGAKIAESTGKVVFKAGGAAVWTAFDGNVDKFAFKNSLEDVIFDFEPPAVVYVDDGWASGTLYADPDGSGPANALGLDAFSSVQPAVDAVQAGGTVYIADGTYPASGQLVFDKTLTVTGQSKAGTTLTPLSDLIGTGDEGAWMLVSPGTTLNLSQVTLDGSGRQIPQALRVNGSAALDNVVIQHIRADNQMGYAVIQGNLSEDDRTLSVTNSSITDFGRTGIQADAAGGSSTVTISNNVITGKGTGDHLDYGVMILGGASATITGNSITSCQGTSGLGPVGSAAVSVSTAADDTTDSAAAISGNILMNNLTAISAGFVSGDDSQVSASFNRIYNNTSGAASLTSDDIAAQNNWWGCNEGPSVPDCDPVTGSVDADPWLVMNISALPSPLVPGSKFTFSADLTDNSAPADTSSEGYLPNGLVVAFSPTDKVEPDSAGLSNGTASTQVSLPVTPVSFSLCAALDGESQCRAVTIAVPTSTWADNDWASEPNGTIVNWGSGDHIIGYDAFDTVQKAVTAVSAGGTATVRPGTYLELVRIAKSLTLTGEDGQMAATSIKPPAGSTSTDSIILVSGVGVSAEITGLTISGPGIIAAGISVIDGADANIHHNQVLDIRTEPLSTAPAVGIQVGNHISLTSGTADISSNLLSGYQKAGVVVAYTGSSASITGNTLTGAGPTSLITQAGIQVLYGASAQIDSNAISRHSYSTGIGIQAVFATANTSGNSVLNNFYGMSLRSSSGTHRDNTLDASQSEVGQTGYYGYSIDNRPPPSPGQPITPDEVALAVAMPELADLPIDVVISGNTIKGNSSGVVGIGVFAGSTTTNISLQVSNTFISGWTNGLYSQCVADCSTSGYPTITAQQNSFTTNSAYAVNVITGAPQVDARLNWWGSQTGPTVSTNVGGAGGIITSMVTYSPWLCSSSDTDLIKPGFQPDLSKKCGLPAKLTFTTQPGGALAGQPLNPQPVVTAQDVDGNLAINFQNVVSLAITANPSGGTLSGTAARTALNGVATFTDLSINKAGIGYTLTASAADLTSTTSQPFDIGNPLPALTSLNPAWVRHDSPDFSLVINGSGFLDSTSVTWNGIPLTVTSRSSSQITVQVPGIYVTSVGSASITAINPGPGGGTSNALVFRIVDETDITVTKTDGLASVYGGSSVTYTVVVTNAGPDPLVDGVFSDPVPAALKDVAWSCVATGAGSNCTPSGTGNSIVDTVDIAVDGTLTYTISGTLPETVSGLLTNTATLSLPTSYADSDGLGLSATDNTILGTLYLNFLPVISR